VGYEAAKAYRELRRLQHVARLDERSGQLEPEQAQAQREAVLKLWTAVFGPVASTQSS
jgi:glutamate-ammonia-ligase adenylyltransferase